VRYGILTQRNPAYLGEVWAELGDLYEGGYTILRNADRYMPRMIGETQDRYRERLKVAAYLCYFGQIVDYFAADLFSQEIAVTPAADADNPDTPGSEPSDPDEFYDSFANDSDLKGTPFGQLLRQAFTSALVNGRAVIAVDFPAQDTDTRPQNKLDEERLGTDRAYAFEVPAEQLIDWECDDRGGFEFAVLHRACCRRASPAEVRDKRVEEFKVWSRTDSGAVVWEVYRTEPYSPDRPPQENDDIPLVARGETSFRRIPLIELRVPAGLWIGNKIGPVAKEHFQRRNMLNAAENKSLFAIPYVKCGSEMGGADGALPSEAQQNPHRGEDPRRELYAKGYLCLGADDDIGFAEPSGAAYDVADKRLERLKDEMFRIVHQMAASVSNSGASLGRSGDSKAEDRHATAIVFGAYGALVRECAVRVYATISEARGETVPWTAHGLDNYDGDDRATIVNEAIQVNQIAIPSLTFAKHYKTYLALRILPNVQPDVAEVIRREIEDGVEDEKRQSEVMAALAEKAVNAGETEPDGDEDSEGDEPPGPESQRSPGKGPPGARAPGKGPPGRQPGKGSPRGRQGPPGRERGSARPAGDGARQGGAKGRSARPSK
jgi:hypothetical protein